MGIFDKLGSHGLVLAVAGVTVIAFLIVLRLAEPWLWKGASKTPNAARRLVQAGETLGLFLIALGVVSVILGSIEYYHTIRRLNRMSATNYKALNFSFIVGLLIGLLGLFLFITILTHTEVF